MSSLVVWLILAPLAGGVIALAGKVLGAKPVFSVLALSALAAGAIVLAATFGSVGSNTELRYAMGGWTAVRALTPTGITVTVDRTTDVSDLNPGDGVCDVSVNAGDQCNLRGAIEELNAAGQGPDSAVVQVTVAAIAVA